MIDGWGSYVFFNSCKLQHVILYFTKYPPRIRPQEVQGVLPWQTEGEENQV